MEVKIRKDYKELDPWSLFEENYEECGFIIPKFLSSTECASLGRGIEKLDIASFTKIQDGFYTYPAAVAHKSDRKFDDPQTVANSDVTQSNQFRANFAVDYGIDLEQRIKDSLLDVFNCHKVDVPVAGEEQEPLASFSIRLLEPKAEIYLHCGNFVQFRHQEFYSRFAHDVQVENQLSFFVVIQEPEIDGELSVFNAKWKDVSERDGEERLVLKNGQAKSPYSFGVHKAAPKIGDLLVFSGGQYWHRVEKVLGAKKRITIGGFIGKSRDNTKVYIWS